MAVMSVCSTVTMTVLESVMPKARKNIGILQNGTPALKGELLRQQCGKAIFGNGLCIVEGVESRSTTPGKW